MHPHLRSDTHRTTDPQPTARAAQLLPRPSTTAHGRLNLNGGGWRARALDALRAGQHLIADQLFVRCVRRSRLGSLRAHLRSSTADSVIDKKNGWYESLITIITIVIIVILVGRCRFPRSTRSAYCAYLLEGLQPHRGGLSQATTECYTDIADESAVRRCVADPWVPPIQALG